MTAIILLCFGTMDTPSLSDADFFRGAQCVSEIARCSTYVMRQWGVERENAEGVCMKLREWAE
jgi:hypothetical protein